MPCSPSDTGWDEARLRTDDTKRDLAPSNNACRPLGGLVWRAGPQPPALPRLMFRGDSERADARGRPCFTSRTDMRSHPPSVVSSRDTGFDHPRYRSKLRNAVSASLSTRSGWVLTR